MNLRNSLSGLEGGFVLLNLILSVFTTIFSGVGFVRDRTVMVFRILIWQRLHENEAAAECKVQFGYLAGETEGNDENPHLCNWLSELSFEHVGSSICSRSDCPLRILVQNIMQLTDEYNLDMETGCT